MKKLRTKHENASGSQRLNIRDRILRILAKKAALKEEDKDAQYYRDQITYRHKRADDHLLLYRQDMAEFAEDRIDLPGGFKYRMRPSKHKPWKYLAISGMGQTFIVDLKKRKRVYTTEGGGKPVDWHPNEMKLINGVGVVDVKTGKVMKKFEPTAGMDNVKAIFDARWFPDGERVIVLYRELLDEKPYNRFKAEIWNVAEKSPEHLKTISFGNDWAVGHRISFSSNGKFFSFDQKTLKTEQGTPYFPVWDSKTLKLIHKVKTKNDEFVQIKFSRGPFDKQAIYTNHEQVEIIVPTWLHSDLHQEKRWILPQISRSTFDIAEGRFIVYANDSIAGLDRIAKGKHQTDLSKERMMAISPGNRIGDIRFGPKGKTVYLVTGNGDLWIYSVKKLMETYEKHINLQNYYRSKLNQLQQEK